MTSNNNSRLAKTSLPIMSCFLTNSGLRKTLKPLMTNPLKLSNHQLRHLKVMVKKLKKLVPIARKKLRQNLKNQRNRHRSRLK